MSTKNEMKDAGVRVGHAFKLFGRTFLRSASRVADKVAPEDGTDSTISSDGSTVFSDGSWKETGKELGGAFAGIGKATVHAAKRGFDAAAEKLDEKQ